LSHSEREKISRGCIREQTFSEIAGRIGRPTSTVSREVNRNGGPKKYRAWFAQQDTLERARRPKQLRLIADEDLAGLVE
jgi:IS30 family transposase